MACNEGVINAKYSQAMIEYALHFICDYNAELDNYRLSKEKVTRSVALDLLVLKGDFYLREFETAFKSALDLALPLNMQSLSMQEPENKAEDYSQNLFEHYSGMDLSFLKGSAILIPATELRMVNKSDDVIRLLDQYYGKDF